MKFADAGCFRMHNHDLCKPVWVVIILAKPVFGHKPCLRHVFREGN